MKKNNPKNPWRERCEELEKQVQTLSAEVEKYKQLLESSEKNQGGSTDLNSWKSEKDKLRSEIVELSVKVKNAEQELSGVITERDQFRTELNNNHTSLQRKLEETNAKLIDWQGSFPNQVPEEIKKQLDKVEQERDARPNITVKDWEDKQTRVSWLEEELAVANQAKDSAIRERDDAHRIIDHRADITPEALAVLQEAKNSTESQLSAALGDLATANWTKIEVEQKYNETHQAQQKAEKERDQRPKIDLKNWDDDYSKRSTQKQLNDANLKLINLDKELKSLKFQNKDFQDKLIETGEENQKLGEGVKTLEQKAESLQTQLTQKEQDISELEEKIKENQIALTEEQEKSKEFQVRLEEKNKAELEQKDQEINNLKVDNKVKDRAIDELQVQLEILHQEKTSFRESITILSGKEGDINQSIELNAKLKIAGEKMDELNKEISSMEDELRNLLGGNDYIIKEINKKVEEWKERWEEDELNKEDKINDKINEFLFSLKKVEKERNLVKKILKLKWELVNKEKEIEKLLKEVKALRVKLEGKKIELKSKIKEAKTNLERELNCLIEDVGSWRSSDKNKKADSLKYAKAALFLNEVLQLQEDKIRQIDNGSYEQEEKKLIEELQEYYQVPKDKLEKIFQIKRELVLLKIQLENTDRAVQQINYYSGTFHAPVFGGNIKTKDNPNFGGIDTQNLGNVNTQHNNPSEAKIQQNNPPPSPNN